MPQRLFHIVVFTTISLTSTLGLSNNYRYVLTIITSPIVVEGNNAIFLRSNLSRVGQLKHV